MTRTSTSVGTGAQGQHYAFGIQDVRATFRLLESEVGESVGVEITDDIVVYEGDKPLLYEQVTSSTSGQSPLTNKAAKFWKTLSDWITIVESDPIKYSNTHFCLYVAQPFQLGEIASLFHSAGRIEHAALEIAKAREIVGFDDGGITNSDISRFFKSNLSITSTIVANLKIEVAVSDPNTDLRALIAKRCYVSELAARAIQARICGWVSRQYQLAIASKQPPVIPYARFHKRMSDDIHSCDRIGKLPQLASAPDAEEIERVMSGSILCKQLELVACSPSDHQKAAADYLLAAADRQKLVEIGELSPQAFDEYEDNLEETWQETKDISEIENPNVAEADLGRLVFRKCMKQYVPIADRMPQDYFVRGCFHTLADGKRIGWHPRFLDLLSDQ